MISHEGGGGSTGRIPHQRLVDAVRLTLGFYGHEVAEEHYGATPVGMRYFLACDIRTQ